MYYLLENNEIIDSNNIKDFDLYHRNYKIKDGKLVIVLGHMESQGKLEMVCIEESVKKQSENVFDLIENGDLLKYKDRFDGIVCLDIVKEVDAKLKTIQLTTNLIKYHEVISFYKPDANGNYIKVWEVKDE